MTRADWIRAAIILLIAQAGLTAEPKNSTTRPASTSAPAIGSAVAAEVITAEPLAGFHGLWSAGPSIRSVYFHLFSGPVATFGPQRVPMAHYVAAANKTFFLYAGMDPLPDVHNRTPALQICVSAFDHATQRLLRPRRLLTSPSDDPAMNATLNIDDKGHLWIFVPRRAREPGTDVYRSIAPHAIDHFERVSRFPAITPQPWYVKGRGFLVICHVENPDTGEQQLAFTRSKDGQTWDAPQGLAAFGNAHAFISGQHQNKVGVAFSFRPKAASDSDVGRYTGQTSLYYAESKDFGATWEQADGSKLALPLTEADSPALVRDYRARGERIHLKDLGFSRRGWPVVFYLRGRGEEPGPQNNWRTFMTVRYTGGDWQFTGLILADNMFDSGAMYLEKGTLWRMISPTIIGRNLPTQSPKPYFAGGEIMMWVSENQGRAWTPSHLTQHSPQNHNFVKRPVNAHEDFYGYWSAGDSVRVSPCPLYYTDRSGQVFQMPDAFVGDAAAASPMPKP